MSAAAGISQRRWFVIFAVTLSALLCYRSIEFTEQRRTITRLFAAYARGDAQAAAFLDLSDGANDGDDADQLLTETSRVISEDFLETTLLSTSMRPVRTSAVGYNEVKDGERYFVYSPSGGFNNQRKELESAMRIAIVLNRTLLVPMIAKHTSGWSKYHDLKNESLLPADVLLDFELMKRYSPKLKLVPMNIPVKQLEEKFKVCFRFGILGICYSSSVVVLPLVLGYQR